MLPSLACTVQGLTLARPEIVPFRLTPSMVDGMGLCGFEGVYRRVMETCMSVLRTNRETLLSVLEPFLQASIVVAEGTAVCVSKPLLKNYTRVVRRTAWN